jgi:hypothetical protein
MTPATPNWPLGGTDPMPVRPVSVEHELEALRAAMAHARTTPAEFDDIEPEFESFLAALTQTPQLRFGHGATSETTLPCRTSWSSLPRAS